MANSNLMIELARGGGGGGLICCVLCLQSARRSAPGGAATRGTRSRASSSATSAATRACACRRATTATRASAPATTTGRPSAGDQSARELKACVHTQMCARGCVLIHEKHHSLDSTLGSELPIYYGFGRHVDVLLRIVCSRSWCCGQSRCKHYYV